MAYEYLERVVIFLREDMKNYKLQFNRWDGFKEEHIESEGSVGRDEVHVSDQTCDKEGDTRV